MESLARRNLHESFFIRLKIINLPQFYSFGWGMQNKIQRLQMWNVLMCRVSAWFLHHLVSRCFLKFKISTCMCTLDLSPPGILPKMPKTSVFGLPRCHFTFALHRDQNSLETEGWKLLPKHYQTFRICNKNGIQKSS